MPWIIYCHTHVESGRRYVGLTARTWQRRWAQHLSQCKAAPKRGWSHFANAIRKYGKDAFSHEVLQVCDTLEAANEAEKAWIARFDSTDPEHGFNILSGGRHAPHPMRNPWDRPDYRERGLSNLNDIRAKAIALWDDPAYRAEQTERLRSLSADPVNRELSLRANLGKVEPLEVRLKISSSARRHPPDHIMCKVHGKVLNEDCYVLTAKNTRHGLRRECRACHLLRIKRRKMVDGVRGYVRA